MDERLRKWEKKRRASFLIAVGVFVVLFLGVLLVLTPNTPSAWGTFIGVNAVLGFIVGTALYYYGRTFPKPALPEPLPGESLAQMEARLISEERLREARTRQETAKATAALAEATHAEVRASRALASAEAARETPISPPDDEASQFKREITREVERLKTVNGTVPQFRKLYEESCAEIDKMEGLSDAAKASLKGQLAIRIEEAIQRLSQPR